MSVNEPMYRLNNDVQMPAVGLGVFNSKPEDTVMAVQSAIHEGYRLIDTAALYANEQQVGEGIRSTAIQRETLFVTTKLWISDYGFDQALHAFDRSLSKLALEYLDLYLIHWPVPGNFDATVSSYRAALRLLEEGRVRAVGVCNFRQTDLKELMKRTDHVPAVNQVELHPFFNQKPLREFHKLHGIATQAWSPIGGVNRYGMKAAKEALPDPLVHPVVISLAERYRKTPAQVIIRWQLELGNSPIPKSVRLERIRENIGVLDFSLEPHEVDSINQLDKGVRGGPDPSQVSLQTFPVTIRD